MGIAQVGTSAEYRAALQKLLPHGEFWERQLADPENDVSKWCDAQAEELRRLEIRKAELADEAILSTTSELIDDWERVAGVDNRTLELDVRRRILHESKTPNLSPGILKNVADAFGAVVLDIVYPFTPVFFGFSHFDSRLATAGALNVIYLYVELAETELRDQFESSIVSVFLASHTTIFFYRTAENEYVPG